MTKFQKLLIEHQYCARAVFASAEDWARHVEDVLNNAGLKVVEVYEPTVPDDVFTGLKGNHPMADGRS